MITLSIDNPFNEWLRGAGQYIAYSVAALLLIILIVILIISNSKKGH